MANNEEIAEIIDTFEMLGDWDERYQYLVEIGEKMPTMDEAHKTDENRVMECMSTVHTAVHADAERPGQLYYTGDCDTSIIKGVVALLVQVLSHKTPKQIERMDIDELFEGLHLEEHLSPNRHVGIYAIVGKMKQQAAALAARAAA